MKGTFTLDTHTGIANAIRRALLDDIVSWAAYKVDFKKNTSCQTDEFIAHRIGLIPVRKVGNGETMNLCVAGRTVMISDMKGPAFEPVHDIEIIEMKEDQEIECTIYFDEKPGSTHARYKSCSAVGIKELKNGNYELKFNTINERNSYDVLKESLEHLQKRLDDSLKQLSCVEIMD